MIILRKIFYKFKDNNNDSIDKYSNENPKSFLKHSFFFFFYIPYLNITRFKITTFFNLKLNNFTYFTYRVKRLNCVN